jgi:hypothetical protein
VGKLVHIDVRTCQTNTDTVRLTSYQAMQFQSYEITRGFKNEITCSMRSPNSCLRELEGSETKVAEEYCWATRQAAGGHTGGDQVAVN